MSAELDLPIFKTYDSNHKFHLIKLIKGKLFCWEELQPCELESAMIDPEKVIGQKQKLIELDIWEKLTPEIQEKILSTNIDTLLKDKPIADDEVVPENPVRGRPPKNPPVEKTERVVSPEPIVKRPRGRPRKNP